MAANSEFSDSWKFRNSGKIGSRMHTDIRKDRFFSKFSINFRMSFYVNVKEEKSKIMKIAGLELLKFKAHLLSDFDLLDIAKSPLNDFREEIVIKTLTRTGFAWSALLCLFYLIFSKQIQCFLCF